MVEICCVDVGLGTEDILFYNPSWSDCFKIVIPAPTQVFARKVLSIKKNNLFFSGGIIGGGPITQSVKNRIKAGVKIVATPEAALTFNYDLAEVKSLGIDVQEMCPDGDFEEIKLNEVDVELINEVSKNNLIFNKLDFIIFAVQDHGKPLDGSSTISYRHKIISDQIKNDPRPLSFLYHISNIPESLLRMRSDANRLSESFDGQIFVADTVIAASIGATLDPQVRNYRNLLTIDIGNGHTFAARLINEEIVGYFETHTKTLTAEKLEKFIKLLSNGSLTNEQVVDEGGHGAYLTDKCDNMTEQIVVTGPRRKIMEKTSLNYCYANPLGDNLMTGAAGLLYLISKKNNIDLKIDW